MRRGVDQDPVIRELVAACRRSLKAINEPDTCSGAVPEALEAAIELAERAGVA